MEDGEKVVQLPNEVVRIVEVASINNSNVPVRLTPTGKISHAKTRVYTQRYRKEWEQMNDFKDWLTSVPNEQTRAFCKFCSRNLHAHRLSLLKHMCTLKHQRAAVQYKKKTSNDATKVPVKSIKIEENLDYSDLNTEDEDMMEETQEEFETFENETEEVTLETSNPDKEKGDTLAQAMVHVNSNFITDSQDIHLEMVIESENEDGNEENHQQMFEIQEQREQEEQQRGASDSSELDERMQQVANDDESGNSVVVADGSVIPVDAKKMYLFSADGKTYTIFKSAPVVPKTSRNEAKAVEIVNKADALLSAASAPTSPKPVTNNSVVARKNNSQQVLNKNTSVFAPSKSANKPKGAMVSTHVLDTSKGVAVSGLQVILYKLSDGRWNFVHENTTSADGLCNDFSKKLTPGRYKFHYDVEKYYNTRKIATVYPFIEIVFDIKDPHKSYHVPLMISPYSYSTHRDILR